MLTFVSDFMAVVKAKSVSMDLDHFEPWRKRMALAFQQRPDIEITKFSEEIGKNRDYIRRLIKDGTANPSPTLFIEICDRLGISAAYVISGEQQSDERDRIARRILEADPETLRRVDRALDLFDSDE